MGPLAILSNVTGRVCSWLTAKGRDLIQDPVESCPGVKKPQAAPECHQAQLLALQLFHLIESSAVSLPLFLRILIIVEVFYLLKDHLSPRCPVCDWCSFLALYAFLKHLVVLSCLLTFKEGAPERRFRTLGPRPGRMSCGSPCKVDQLDCSIGRTADARIWGSFLSGGSDFPRRML